MKKDFFQVKRLRMNLLSRAYFKLEEINKKFKILNSESKVLELGAAPGGWTQYIKIFTNQIIAVDLLPLKISGVKFFQEDIRTFQTEEQFHLILSDIAPNLTGNWSSDTIKMEMLLDCIINRYLNNLKTGGHLILKIFNNQTFLKQYTNLFTKYKFFKPKASKPQSREMYFIGINKK